MALSIATPSGMSLNSSSVAASQPSQGASAKDQNPKANSDLIKNLIKTGLLEEKTPSAALNFVGSRNNLIANNSPVAIKDIRYMLGDYSGSKGKVIVFENEEMRKKEIRGTLSFEKGANRFDPIGAVQAHFRGVDGLENDNKGIDSDTQIRYSVKYSEDGKQATITLKLDVAEDDAGKRPRWDRTRPQDFNFTTKGPVGITKEGYLTFSGKVFNPNTLEDLIQSRGFKLPEYTPSAVSGGGE